MRCIRVLAAVSLGAPVQTPHCAQTGRLKSIPYRERRTHIADPAAFVSSLTATAKAEFDRICAAKIEKIRVWAS